MVAIASSLKPEAKAHEAIEAARAWLDDLSRIVLATVVRTWGSSPVPVGGQLAVASDERFEGSVSGVSIEAEVIFEAMDVISTGRPKLLEFGITNESAWRAGLPCGGRIEIYVEALVAGRDGAYLDAVLEARATRSPMVVRTALSNGSRELFDARATLIGATSRTASSPGKAGLSTRRRGAPSCTLGRQPSMSSSSARPTSDNCCPIS